jgi:hypothetical protein
MKAYFKLKKPDCFSEPDFKRERVSVILLQPTFARKIILANNPLLFQQKHEKIELKVLPDVCLKCFSFYHVFQCID